jgi:hypothetical protein
MSLVETKSFVVPTSAAKNAQAVAKNTSSDCKPLKPPAIRRGSPMLHALCGWCGKQHETRKCPSYTSDYIIVVKGADGKNPYKVYRSVATTSEDAVSKVTVGGDEQVVAVARIAKKDGDDVTLLTDD